MLLHLLRQLLLLHIRSAAIFDQAAAAFTSPRGSLEGKGEERGELLFLTPPAAKRSKDHDVRLLFVECFSCGAELLEAVPNAL
jgi:hypothetical protein